MKTWTICLCLCFWMNLYPFPWKKRKIEFTYSKTGCCLLWPKWLLWFLAYLWLLLLFLLLEDDSLCLSLDDEEEDSLSRFLSYSRRWDHSLLSGHWDWQSMDHLAIHGSPIGLWENGNPFNSLGIETGNLLLSGYWDWQYKPFYEIYATTTKSSPNFYHGDWSCSDLLKKKILSFSSSQILISLLLPPLPSLGLHSPPVVND